MELLPVWCYWSRIICAADAKILKVDMAKERAKLAEDAGNAPKSFKTKGLIAVDSLGMMPLCLTIVLGLIIGLIKIPLPGGAFFSLGTIWRFRLIAGLLVGQYCAHWTD